MSQANAESSSGRFEIRSRVRRGDGKAVVVSLLACALSAAIAGLTVFGCSEGPKPKSLFITPASAIIYTGQSPSSQTFVCEVNWSDGTTGGCTGPITGVWSSSNTAVATMNGATANAVADGVTNVVITDSQDNLSASALLAVNLSSIAVTPQTATIATTGSQQFTATANYVDNTTGNLTAAVNWASSNAQVATMSTTTPGLANGAAAGTTNISATYGSVTSNMAALSVTGSVAAATQYLLNAPSSADTGVPFTVTVTAATASGATATGYTGTVQFKSSDTAAVLPANYTFTAADAGVHTFTNGFTLNTVGSQTITATDTVSVSITGNVQVTVTAPTLNSISVTPVGATIAQGTTQQYTATGNYSDGSTQNLTTQVTWGVTPSSGVATISNAAGSQGLATGVGPGTATIAATLGTVTGTTTLNVSGPTLQSITVTPITATVALGGSQQFTATGNYSGGGTQNLTTQVTWSSSNMTVATISNTAPNQGLATAGTGSSAVGFSTITATLGSGANAISGTASLFTQQGYVSVASRYLLDLSGNNISVDAVVPTTGQLRAVGMSAINTAVNYPRTIVGIPGTNVLYYVSVPSFGLEIDTYLLGANGLLVDLNAPVSSQNYEGTPLPDPLGRFLYVDDDNGSIVVFQINALTGNPLSPATALSGLSVEGAMTIDPTGSYFFLQNESGSITAYSIDSNTGVLSQIGSPVNAPSSIYQMSVSPSGKLLYVLGSGGITAYSINAGALTEVTNSPFSVPSSGTVQQFAIDPSGNYLYLTEEDADGLYGYAIAGNGALTPMQSGSSFAVGQRPGPINIGAEDQYVYVNNQESTDIWVYSLASGTGLLTPVSIIRTQGSMAQVLDTGAAPLTFTPESLFVVDGTIGTGSVAQFTVDPSTGNLTSLATELGAGGDPQTIVTDPYGLYAYVPDLVSPGTLYGYSVSNTTGLAYLAGFPFASGNGPSWLATDLSGSFLYGTMQTDSTIWKYDLSSGVPGTGASSVGTQTGPDFIIGDPSGQYLITGASSTTPGGVNVGVVQSYKINLPQGGLFGVNSFSQGVTSAKSIAVDPSGRYVYVGDSVLNFVWALTLSNTGSLAVNTLTRGGFPGPNTDSPGPSSIVIEPSGKYLYATNQSLNMIFAFSIDPSTGALSDVLTTMSIGQVANTDQSPVALAVDISGQYLYCVNLGNSGAGTIDIFSIDLSTGFLTPVASVSGLSSPGGLALTGTRH